MSVLFRVIIELLSGMRWLVRSFAATLVAVALCVSAATAQELDGDRAALLARKEALFQQMLREPGNLDIAFAYADTAAKLGDNEAAVSALERMLLFNPNLARVQLELGVLYFRMGSYEISRTYFDKARAANPPAEVKSRIDTYLAEINRLSAPQRLTGFLLFGPQYQSNANLAPGSPLVHSPIGDVLLNSEFVKKHDWNFFATGSALYSYDLGTQDRDTIEVGGTGFANHYGVVNRLDLGLVEATVGPRFNFPLPFDNIKTVSLKPYGIANYVGLGNNPYFYTLGVGGEMTTTVWDDIRLRSVFEFRNKNFNDAPDRPLSRGLTGSDKLFSLFVSKPITTTPFASELALEFDYLRQDTRLSYFANNTYAGAIAYRVRYGDPTGYLHLPWETTFFFSTSWANYNSPDPCCNTSGNPFVFTPATRNDHRLRFGVTQNFQVSENLSIVVQLQRDIVSSNLSLYGYSGNSILVGPQIRF